MQQFGYFPFETLGLFLTYLDFHGIKVIDVDIGSCPVQIRPLWRLDMDDKGTRKGEKRKADGSPRSETQKRKQPEPRKFVDEEVADEGNTEADEEAEEEEEEEEEEGGGGGEEEEEDEEEDEDELQELSASQATG